MPRDLQVIGVCLVNQMMKLELAKPELIPGELLAAQQPLGRGSSQTRVTGRGGMDRVWSMESSKGVIAKSHLTFVTLVGDLAIAFLPFSPPP